MTKSIAVLGISFLLFATLENSGCGNSELNTEIVDARSTIDSRLANDGNIDQPKTFPSLGVLEADKVAIAAARLSTCVPDDPAQNWIRKTYLKLRPNRGGVDVFDLDAINCLASATDGCASMAECTGLAFDLSGPCQPSCDGEKFTVCDDQWRITLDCSFSGLTCDANRGCIDSAATVCTGNDRTCEAGVPTGCSQGAVRQGYVCVDYGLGCDTTSPACTGLAGTCDSGGRSTYGVEAMGIYCANENALNACVNGGLHTIRCSDISSDFGCQTRDGESFCGLSDECAPFTNGNASCDGTSLQICNAGRTTIVDCVAAGFTGCSLGGRDGAYCSPSSWRP